MTLPDRDCDYCKEPFTPKRVDQRFCIGKDCRKRFHAEYNQSHVHTCWHCGHNHDPEEPAFLDVLELMLKADDIDLVDQLLELIRRRRGSVVEVADEPDVP